VLVINRYPFCRPEGYFYYSSLVHCGERYPVQRSSFLLEAVSVL
jgi:hypothetical protein